MYILYYYQTVIGEFFHVGVDFANQLILSARKEKKKKKTVPVVLPKKLTKKQRKNLEKVLERKEKKKKVCWELLM